MKVFYLSGNELWAADACLVVTLRLRRKTDVSSSTCAEVPGQMPFLTVVLQPSYSRTYWVICMVHRENMFNGRPRSGHYWSKLKLKENKRGIIWLIIYEKLADNGPNASVV